MNIDGTCLCGQIQFEANVDPETTTICHCTDCQINSGTAFGYVVGAVNDSFNPVSYTHLTLPTNDQV